MERKQPHVGDCVVFTDSEGADRNALVTAVFGEVTHNPLPDGSPHPLTMPCLNAVWVSKDEAKQDPYGRQIERDQTSIVHATSQPAHGNYWRWPGGDKNPIQAPTER
jgi:hypothetical protein